MYRIKMSSKGQIVIPIKLREKYHLEQGAEVAILEYPEEIVIVPLPKDAVKEARGMLKSKKSVRQMLEEARREERRLDKRFKKTRKAS